LVSSVPTAPEVFVLPEYPPVARAERVEGVVSFIVEVDTNGVASHLTIENCDPLLCPIVREAVSGWRFPPEAISYEVKATIEFALNCP
jgi:outer membrane biosynthesis protein TonB